MITRAGWIRILVITIVGIAILPFTPGPRQLWNMHLARIHADKLRLIIGNDPRFHYLRLGTYSGAGGSLMVSADVENDKTKEELKKIVVASSPPVKVVFVIRTDQQLREGNHAPN